MRLLFLFLLLWLAIDPARAQNRTITAPSNALLTNNMLPYATSGSQLSSTAVQQSGRTNLLVPGYITLGGTTNRISDDGSSLTRNGVAITGGGGGTAGSMINTTANVAGAVPRATSTNPTNYVPSTVIVDGSGNVTGVNSLVTTTLNAGTLNLTNGLARSLLTNSTPYAVVANDATGLLTVIDPPSAAGNYYLYASSSNNLPGWLEAPGSSSTYANWTAIGTTNSTLAGVASVHGVVATNTTVFNVKNFGAVGNGTTDDSTAINAAISAATNVLGGIVEVPTGVYAVASTIRVGSSVHIRGASASAYVFNRSTLTKGSVLKWTGASGGTLLLVQPETISEPVVNPLIENLSLDGNTTNAAYCLKIEACVQGVFRNIAMRSAQTACLWAGYYANTNYTGLNFTHSCEFTSLWIENVENGAAQGGNGIGIYLTGDKGGGAGTEHDVTLCSFSQVMIYHEDGVGLHIDEADNNRFYSLEISRRAGGTGVGIELSGNDPTGVGARKNSFYGVYAGPGGVMSRATGLASPALDNYFYGYSISSGTPLPVVEAGSTCYWETLGGNHFILDMHSRNQTNTGKITIGSGDAAAVWQATTAQKLTVRAGTAAAPDTNTNNLVKVERTVSIPAGDVFGDGGEQLAALQAVTVDVIGNGVAPVGLYGGAVSISTNGVAPLGVYGVGRVSGTGTGVALGGFFHARRDTTNGSADAVELAVDNNTTMADSYTPTGWNRTLGIWLHPIGATNSAAGMVLGNNTGMQFDVGLAFNAQVAGGTTGAVKTASIRDDSTAVTSIDIRGQHATGIDISSATMSGAALKLSSTQLASLGTQDPSGVGIFNYSLSGQNLGVYKGLWSTPDTVLNPLVKIERISNLTATGESYERDAERSAALSAIHQGGAATSSVSIVGVLAGAEGSSTNTTNGVADTMGIKALSIIDSPGVGYAQAGFFQAYTDSAAARASGVHISSYNNTLTATAYSPTTLPKSSGVYMVAEGLTNSTVGLELSGGGNGQQYDVGLAINGFINNGSTGAVKTATIRDDGNALSSIIINGKHTTGIDLSGATISGNAISLAPTQTLAAGIVTAAGAITGTGNISTSLDMYVGSTRGIGFASRSFFHSAANGSFLFQNNTGTDFDKVQLGGTTSSFPAIGRSTEYVAITDAAGGNTSGLIINGTTPVLGVISATATLDFGSILAAASADLTITVTGAAVGDSVSLGLPAAPLTTTAFNGFVSAADTVTVRCFNVGTIAADPASATYRATVTHF